MSCIRLTRPVSKRLTSMTTDTSYTWYTPYVPCIGIDALRATLKRRALNKTGTGNLETSVAIQLAPVVRFDKPMTTAVVGSWVPDQGELCTGDVDISTLTAANFLVRFGVAHRLTGSATFGEADVDLRLSYNSFGRYKYRAAFDATAVAAGPYFKPVGSWVPAQAAQKLMLAMVVTDATTKFQCRACWRSADTSPEVPNAWVLAEAGYTVGNSERNTGLLSTTATTAMWVQAGVAYGRSTGTALEQAVVAAYVGVRTA